ncbi:MAG: histidinol dehydrogenase [Desulfitobacteriia bacterium]|jgi:histidinol dehydrogenase
MKEILQSQDWDLKKYRSKPGIDSKNLEDLVAKIIDQVREFGDQALYDLTQLYDGVDIKERGLKVLQEEITGAYKKVDQSFLNALQQAKKNILSYHKKQLRASWFNYDREGVLTGQLIRPLQRVGIYVPGGTAAYPSSVLMNALPALAAGVEEIVMVTPPLKDGTIAPEVLTAAAECGIKEIYRLGGAQAISALAYGTETIEPVDKITGPGNIYVTLAKKQLFGVVDIDMLAGPSEILILADENNNPAELAADLLSQAEHDKLASAILISPVQSLLEEVAAEIERQLPSLPRYDIARSAWDNYGALIQVKDLEEGFKLVNELAPEHLELAVRDPFSWLSKIKNAGAVFLGSHTPEPVGDYFAGPNHVLPTSGTARFFSALDVDAFLKKTSIINYSPEALEREADPIMLLARKEGLEAHARAIEVRKNKGGG